MISLAGSASRFLIGSSPSSFLIVSILFLLSYFLSVWTSFRILTLAHLEGVSDRGQPLFIYCVRALYRTLTLARLEGVGDRGELVRRILFASISSLTKSIRLLNSHTRTTMLSPIMQSVIKFRLVSKCACCTGLRGLDQQAMCLWSFAVAHPPHGQGLRVHPA